ncbi:MAG: VacJ family lipoprotein [Deltaproteobacteria bacterium]|nr:VacJ family lipoprotein [Deltaproteobacteria bacterium]MBT4526549.1 VacJ family lipoprotein [Deltaproteobacteria bacterium]
MVNRNYSVIRQRNSTVYQFYFDRVSITTITTEEKILKDIKSSDKIEFIFLVHKYMEKLVFTVLLILTSVMILGCSQKSPEKDNLSSGQINHQSNINQDNSNVTSENTLPNETVPVSNESDEMGNDEFRDFNEEEDEFSDVDELDEMGDEFGDLDSLDEGIEDNQEDEIYDPFEGYNRTMTDLNDGLYLYILDPVASGYAYVVPEGGRKGVSNFIDNLFYPIRLVNNILQAKFYCAGKETLRFVINCTIGILGIFDPAEDWFGIEPCVEDFGQTLGFWGVGPGPHFVLPFLGPSNFRDMFSLYPDSFYDLIARIKPLERQVLFRAFKAVNTTSLHLGEYQLFKKDAYDYYLFFRDAYEQNRQKLIEE